MIKKLLSILTLLFLLSCNDEVNKKLNGQWYLVDNIDNSQIIAFKISNDSIRVVDNLGTTFLGIVSNNKFKIRLPNNKQEEVDFNFNDSLITIFDSIVFYKSNFERIINRKSVIEFLEINTNVVFPFIDIETNDKVENSPIGRTVHVKTSITLLNTTNPRKYLAGDTKISVSELYNYFPSSRCSNARHLSYRYDEVAILLEKNVSVADLIILEQFLLLNNHIRKFMLITKCKEIGVYNVVVDKRIHFDNDFHTIAKLISKYQENLKNLSPPPPYPPPLPPLPLPDKNLEKYIKSISGEIVLLSNLEDYKSKKKYLLRNRQIIVIKLSSKMKIDDYVSILSDLQNLRIKGVDFKVHILS